MDPRNIGFTTVHIDKNVCVAVTFLPLKWSIPPDPQACMLINTPGKFHYCIGGSRYILVFFFVLFINFFIMCDTTFGDGHTDGRTHRMMEKGKSKCPPSQSAGIKIFF
jgi:hypothetical protein